MVNKRRLRGIYMPEGITIGDIIGYIISFGMGALTGGYVISKKYSNSKSSVVQTGNKVRNGDIIGGDKIGK